MDSIDWKCLPFGYIKTDYNVRSFYREGKWSKLELSTSEFLNVHMAATGLHYGQEAFEGMKAYMGRDGKIRLFRWEENAQRLIFSAKGVMMAEVPAEMFKEAVMTVVKKNKRFVPPYGSGANCTYQTASFWIGR